MILNSKMRGNKLALFCEHWRPVFMEDGHIKDVECLDCRVVLGLP